MSRHRLLLAALGVAVVALSGCGHSAANRDTVGMTPMQVVLGAQAATEKAKTAKTSFSIDTSVDGGDAVAFTGDGAYDFAKNVGVLHASFPSPAGGTLDMDLVTTESTLYLKSDSFAAFTSKPWISVEVGAAGESSLSPFGSSDPSQGLAFLQGVKTVRLAGEDDIRAVKCQHYDATIDLTAVKSSLAGGATTGSRLESLVEDAHALPIDVWVDGQNRVTRTVMTMRIKASEASKGKSSTTKVSTDWYDFGTSVDVAIPPASQVADGSKLLSGSRG